MARALLENAAALPWRYQGLGVLQLNLEDGYRLHVWHPLLRHPGVSMIHDHLQWDFESWVLCGRMVNVRYQVGPAGQLYEGLGVDTGAAQPNDKPRLTRLVRGLDEVYREGNWYRQEASEIHESLPDAGTVTLIRRQRTDRGDIATVFYPFGSQWGTAPRRPATPYEIGTACGAAIQTMKESA